MVYRVALGATLSGTWSLGLLAAMVYFSSGEPSSFGRFGPSDDVVFGGMKIDTWAKWSFVMTYAVVSQIVYSVVSSTISPYVSNVIRDHKTPAREKGSYVRSQSLVQLYTLYHWLASIFDVFLWITMQLQYLLPALLTDLALTGYFTHGYLNPRGALASPILDQ